MKVVTLLYLLFLSNILLGQSISNDFHFFNLEEKESYEKESGQAIFQQFYLASPENSGALKKASNEFFSYIETLRKETLKKKPVKKVNFIYKDIHEKYFKKYIENTDFQNIFSSSEYNCVTATALYYIALKALNIPVAIKEMPTHVYLLAYPNSHRIIFESTDPLNGSISVNTKQIQKYRENLVSNKLISKQEGKEYDEEKIFNEYILSDSTINISNLIGIQYYNNSIQHSEEEKFKIALIQAEKAHHLYKSDYITLWSEYLCSYLLEKQSSTLSANEYAHILSKVTKYNIELEDLMAQIRKYYIELAFVIIEEENGASRLASINEAISRHTKPDSISKELCHFGNLVLAEYHLKALNVGKALELFAKSYQTKNKQQHLLIRESLSMHLGGIQSGTKGLDSLDKYENIFPFVKEDRELQSFGVWCYAKLIYNHFELNEYEEGNKRLDEFRSRYTPQRAVYYRDELIGNIFGSASAYQIRKKDNYEQAKALLREGLEYAPECLELRRKMKYIKEIE